MKSVIFVLLFCIFASLAFHFASIESKYKHRDKIHLKHSSVNNTKGVKFSSNLLRDNEETLGDAVVDDVQKPYLVKFNVPITNKLKKLFSEKTGAKLLEYIPHQTYLVKACSKQLTKAKELSDVIDFIAEYSPEYKISSELLKPENIITEAMSHESFDEFDSWTKSFIHVFGAKKYKVQSDEAFDRVLLLAVHLLPEYDRSLDDTFALSEQFSTLLSENQIPVAFLRAVSKNKIVLGVPVKSVKKAAQTVAGHHSAHWVEHMSHVIGKRENWDIRSVMQSGDVKSKEPTPFNNAGVTGVNQIVAYADSGLDVYSCFFHDENNKAPFIHRSMKNESSIHRKIHAYGAFMDNLDDEHGHGTHVAGTIAGSSLYPTSPISKYNGHAPDAKLAVFDIGCQNKEGCECSKFGSNCPCSVFPNGRCPSSKSLVLPFDLHAGYFSWAYEVGARIHSNSIGGTIGAGYTGTTREMDRFIYDHPDFLVFWSAGNSGRNEGYMTLTGPTKQAKNAVIVGCSTSPYEGWQDVLNNVRDYKARGALMKKAIDQQGFCSCNTTCQTYACAQAKMLTSEEGCCQVFDNCKLEHPEQEKNPQANVVNMCCKQCAVGNLNNEQFTALYQKDNLAVFSSLGPSLDGRIKPDLVAPGYFAMSAKSHESNPDSVCTASNSNDVKFNVREMAGTSMATPAAAANGALVRDYFMQGFYPSGEANFTDSFEPTAALVKAVLIASARPMKGLARNWTPLNAFTASQRRYFEGFGLINLSNALYLKDNSATARVFVTDRRRISTHQVHSYTVETPTNGELSVTLVWTDPAASPAASIALVNDLDLVVTYKNTKYLGNAADESVVDADRVNNVEKVIIPNALAGTYQVQIRGFHVPEGPQRYALVINGKTIDADTIEKSFNKQSLPVKERLNTMVYEPSSDVGAPASEAWYNKDISIKTWLFAVIVSAQGIALVVAVVVLIAVIVMVAKNMKNKQNYEQLQ